MNRALWQNPRIVSTFLFVFLSGAVAGAITMRFGFPIERHRQGPYWSEGGRDISLQRFKKELNLTPSQAAEIELVLDDFVKYYQTLQAQMDDVRSTGKNRITRLLNEEQKLKFEHMMTELQARQQLR
ncbi:MAG: hypothetical protein HYZ57_00895 [Acidobacteria bacterium]|nr:hypothetical protein [Acidobacteriota bacterium]MBI3278379.1 hypothetical protein [Acidobacteriota bacterium]